MSDHEHTEPEPDERPEDVEDPELPEGDQQDVSAPIRLDPTEGELT